MALIPRKIRELREELLTVQQDIAAEVAAVIAIKKTPNLSPEQRQTLAAINSRLREYRERQAELEAEINAEVAKYVDRKAVEARQASRQTIKTVHERVAARHLTRAEQVEQWRQLSVQLFAGFHADFAADSATLETAVKHLCDSDPLQFARAMEHALPAIRGNDVWFATALAHAFSDIAVAAAHGTVKGTKANFAKVAAEHVKIIDQRLPVIHSAAEADIGENPELEPMAPGPEPWVETITKAQKIADERQAAERAAAPEPVTGKTDEFVELIRDGKQPRAKR